MISRSHIYLTAFTLIQALSQSVANLFDSTSITCDAINFDDYILPDALYQSLPPGFPPAAVHIFSTVAGLQGGWTPGLKMVRNIILLTLTDDDGHNDLSVVS